VTILQLRRYQKKDADLDAVAASGVAAAWTAYNPGLTAGGGSFTTASSAGRYLRMGKLVCVNIVVIITTNGTAGGYVTVNLPVTPQGDVAVSGREVQMAGFGLAGSLSSGTLINIQTSGGGYPGGSGYRLVVFTTYEAA